MSKSKDVSLMPSIGEWTMLKEQASMVVRTGLLPKAIDTAEKAIAIALKGRELGIPPMHAFSHIHIVQGKPTISSELMLSLIYKNCPGAIINYLKNDSKICEIEASRPGHKAAKFSYTIEEAKQAGLLNKDSWRNYPAAMLRARAISIVGRAIFPDLIMGCSYIPEELGADVNEDGEVLTIPVEPKKEDAVLNERLELGKKIMTTAKELELGKAELAKWATEEFGCMPTEMTIDQMEDFLDQLHGELVLKEKGKQLFEEPTENNSL